MFSGDRYRNANMWAGKRIIELNGRLIWRDEAREN
jgi:hypothetical protein